MNYKVEGALRRNKKYFILFGILWLFAAIVLIMPITLGYNVAINQQNMGEGLNVFLNSMKNPIQGFSDIASNNLMQAYLKTLGGFSIIFAIFFVIGVVRSAPKNEYTDFEHGSSDWSKNGEQY